MTHRSFGSAVKTTVPADLRPLSAPRGGTAHWRMQAGWRRVWAPTRRRVRSSKDRPSRALAVTRACRLRAASQRRLANVCAPSKVASKCSTLLRMNSGSRQSCTQDCICLGLCASEEERFACILRFGRKLVSVYQLTLPLVAACSCACVIRLSRAHCKTTRSNAKATNDLHSHMTHHMASHKKYSKGTPQYRNGILTSDVSGATPLHTAPQPVRVCDRSTFVNGMVGEI